MTSYLSYQQSIQVIPKFISGNFVQFIGDNVNHNVRTLDGANTFHRMNIIAVTSFGVCCSEPFSN